MNLLELSINRNSLPKYISFRSRQDDEFLNQKINSKKFNNYSRRLKRLILEKDQSKIIFFDHFVKERIDFSKLYESLEEIMNQSSELIFFLNQIDSLINEVLYLTLEYSLEQEESTIEEISDIFNRFATDKKIMYSHINSIDDLIFLFNNWSESNQNQRELILEITERNSIINQELNVESDEITSTEINISRIQYDSFVQLVKPFNQYSSEQIIQIFNSFQLNDELIAIQLNTNNRVYIKFNRREKIEQLQEVRDLCSVNQDSDHLFFFVFDESSERIFQFDLSLESSILSFRFTNNISTQVNFNEENEVFNLLSRNIDLTFNEILPMKIIASFLILNISINPVIFIDMLLNDDIMNTYFFIDESLSIFSEKKRIIIRMIDDELIFENQSQNEEIKSILISNLSIESLNKREKFILDSGESLSLNQNDQIIRVNIVKSDSFNTIDKFIEYFKKILTYYLSNRESTIRQYQNFFPELHFKETTEKRKKQSRSENRYNLKDYAPDVFVLGYSRECQKLRQPIPLETEEEVNQIREQEFEFKGSRMKREVLNYPKNSNRYRFVCLNDSFPFVGVKKSNLSNSREYPYIPCCFETPQIGDDINSKYNEYYLGIERKQSQKKKFILSNEKNLDPDTFGSVDRRLNILFEELIPKNHSLMRYGVINDNLSIIHCVLTGLKVREYLELKSEEEKRNYSKEIRNEIIRSSYPELGRQELFDYSNQEIIEYLSSDEEYWNSKLVFRFIEEYFKINLIVFREIEIEVPRFKSFHIRIIDETRNSIVLLKKDRHYELLLFSRNLSFENSTIFFNSNFIKTLIDYRFEIISVEEDMNTDDLIHSVKILSQSIPVKQFIDINGKSFGYITSDEFVIFTKPNRPFNLIEYNEQNIFLKSEEEVLSKFGTPSRIETMGVWFDDFFIPTDEEVFESNELISKSNNIEKIIDSIHKNRIISSVLMNSIIQTQLIMKLTSAEEFFKKIIILSNQDYQINFNSTIDLESNDLIEFFTQLNSMIGGLIDLNEMKIKINDRTLYNKLFYFTRLYFENNQIKFRNWRSRINNLLQFEEDFNGEVVFGVEKLNEWINSVNITNNNILQERFIVTDQDLFLYYDQINHKNYFIQRSENQIQAVNISIIWNQEQVNNGIDTIKEAIEGVDYNDISRIKSIDGVLLLNGKLKDVKLLFTEQKIYSLLEFH
jgi:hypothetical protein